MSSAPELTLLLSALLVFAAVELVRAVGIGWLTIGLGLVAATILVVKLVRRK
jgi:hypothetical protein